MKNIKTGRKSGAKQPKGTKKAAPLEAKKVLRRRGSKIGAEDTKETQNTQKVVVFDGSVRINKRIKDLGLASRRDADKLLESNKVYVNGKVAKLGSKVKMDDKIEIKQNSFDYKYYTFYKPRDVVSHSPQYGEDEVKDFFPNWDKDNLTIVGRLDKHSEGLMLVTSDKRLVERILDPKFGHDRVYEVTVQEKLSKNIETLFKKGFEVRGRFTAKPAKVEILNNHKFYITLTEGKKHQIRLMTNELHYTVSELKRIKILNLNLKGIGPGQAKEIKKEEVIKLLKFVGLN